MGWSLLLEKFLIRGIQVVSVISLLLILTSCGTLFGGRIQNCQKTKPPMDHREIRPWTFVADIPLFPIAMPVDFWTGAIYKPCNKNQVNIVDKKPKVRLGKKK